MSVVIYRKHKNCQIWRSGHPERLVSTMNQSNLAKNWLQYASNRRTVSTSITNSAFLFSAHAHNLAKCYEGNDHQQVRASCCSSASRVASSGKSLGWKWGVFNTPSSLGHVFRRIFFNSSSLFWVIFDQKEML